MLSHVGEEREEEDRGNFRGRQAVGGVDSSNSRRMKAETVKKSDKGRQVGSQNQSLGMLWLYLLSSSVSYWSLKPLPLGPKI